MTTTEIKPCPFCGGVGDVFWKAAPNSVTGWWYSVQCNDGCLAEGWFDSTEEGAIEKWNTRTPAVGGVKPLEWHDDTEGPGCPIRFAAWPLHGYRVHLYQWGEADTWAVRFGMASGVFLPKKGDADAAKAMVQAEWSDYLQRAVLTAALQAAKEPSHG